MGNAAAVSKGRTVVEEDGQTSAVQAAKHKEPSKSGFDQQVDGSDTEFSGGFRGQHTPTPKRARLRMSRKSRDQNAAAKASTTVVVVVAPDDEGEFSRPLPHRLPAMIDEIDENAELSDEHIDHAQGLLRNEFAEISGFFAVSVLAVVPNAEVKPPTSKFIQIFHLKQRHHWICASNLLTDDDNAVIVYDSAMKNSPILSFDLQEKLAAMLNKRGDVIVDWADVKRQQNALDCGLHAIAAATSLCHGIPPERMDWDLEQMRPHLSSCFRQARITPFPAGDVARDVEPVVRTVFRIRCPCRLPVCDEFQDTWRCPYCQERFHRKCVAKWIQIDEPFCCDLCRRRA